MVYDYNYRILECRHFIAPSASRKIERVVKDYEFDFYLKGDRVMYIDDIKYTIAENDLVFRYPGQKVYSYGDYDCYTLTIDFSCIKSVENYNRNISGLQQIRTNLSITQNIPVVFSPCHTDTLRTAWCHLAEQYDLNSELSHSILWEILCLINSDAMHIYNQKYQNNAEAIDDVKQYIDKNYASYLSLDLLSRVFHMNKYHLVRVFSKKFKKTPVEYLISVRLDNARELLMATDLSVKNIASMCGYHDEAYFIKEYRKKYGTSPSRHRNSDKWV